LTRAQGSAMRVVLARKRARHPAVAKPPDWSGLMRILERERITLLHVPLPRPAQLVQYCGAWAILLDSQRSRRRDLFYACHELAHLWLHTNERDAFTRDTLDRSTEDEANTLAEQLMGKRDPVVRRFNMERRT